MKVFEFQCKIKFLKDIEYQNVYEKTTYLLDSVLVKDEQYLKFHESKDYKFYVTDGVPFVRKRMHGKMTLKNNKIIKIKK